MRAEGVGNFRRRSSSKDVSDSVAERDWIMNARLTLEQIDVPNPCPANWSAMTGDRRGRFCQHCQKTVHNLSAMSRDEAERLVCQAAGSLCVRYAVTTDGRVMTLDYPTISGKRGWSWRVWSVIGLAGALVTGVVNATFFGSRVMPGSTVVVGAMVARPMPPSGPYSATCTRAPTAISDQVFDLTDRDLTATSRDH